MQLECDPQGKVSLGIGGEILASRDLGPLAHAGWFGLFAGRSSGRAGDDPAQVVFRDATVRLDP